MHLAARNGHARAIRLLAAHNGYVNARDKVSVCVHTSCDCESVYVVCMYVCMIVCVRMRACERVCYHVNVCMCACVHACYCIIFVCVYACVSVCAHITVYTAILLYRSILHGRELVWP